MPHSRQSKEHLSATDELLFWAAQDNYTLLQKISPNGQDVLVDIMKKQAMLEQQQRHATTSSVAAKRNPGSLLTQETHSSRPASSSMEERTPKRKGCSSCTREDSAHPKVDSIVPPHTYRNGRGRKLMQTLEDVCGADPPPCPTDFSFQETALPLLSSSEVSTRLPSAAVSQAPSGVCTGVCTPVNTVSRTASLCHIQEKLNSLRARADSGDLNCFADASGSNLGLYSGPIAGDVDQNMPGRFTVDGHMPEVKRTEQKQGPKHCSSVSDVVEERHEQEEIKTLPERILPMQTDRDGLMSTIRSETSRGSGAKTDVEGYCLALCPCVRWWSKGANTGTSYVLPGQISGSNGLLWVDFGKTKGERVGTHDCGPNAQRKAHESSCETDPSWLADDVWVPSAPCFDLAATSSPGCHAPDEQCLNTAIAGKSLHERREQLVQHSLEYAKEVTPAVEQHLKQCSESADLCDTATVFRTNLPALVPRANIHASRRRQRRLVFVPHDAEALALPFRWAASRSAWVLVQGKEQCLLPSSRRTYAQDERHSLDGLHHRAATGGFLNSCNMTSCNVPPKPRPLWRCVGGVEPGSVYEPGWQAVADLPEDSASAYELVWYEATCAGEGFFASAVSSNTL